MRAASIAAVTSAPPPPRCPRGTDTCDAALEGPTEASAGEAGSTTGGGSDEADGPVTHCGVMRCDPAWRDEWSGGFLCLYLSRGRGRQSKEVLAPPEVRPSAS